MPNQLITTTNKQTDRGWLCTENLLSVDGSKTVSIPHKTYYDCTTSTGLTISLIVQPSTSFRIGKKDIGGWEITYSSGIVTFTVYNTSTSLSVSNSVLVNKLSRITVYYTTSGNIGIYVGSSNSKVESSGTITGDCTNTNPILISGTSLCSYLVIYNKQLSDFEIDVEDISIIPKSLHPNCVGFWPIQERTGAKAYDSVESFNYAKSKFLPDLKLANWNKNTSLTNVTYNEGADYIGAKVTGAYTGPIIPYLYTSGLTINVGTYYTMIIDIEIFATAAGQVNIDCYRNQHFGDANLNFNTPGRQRKTLTWSPTVSSNEYFTIEANMYEANAEYRVYEAKIYKTFIGPPLESNHADLIGYTATELGIPDETTQTAKVDFYTKTVTDRTDGSGVDLKSGFPELKNAMKVSPAYYANNTTFTNPKLQQLLNNGEFTLSAAFYLGVADTNASFDLIHIRNNTPVNWESITIRIINSSIVFSVTDQIFGSQGDIVGDNPALKSGWNYATVTRSKEGLASMYLSGRNCGSSNMWQNQGQTQNFHTITAANNAINVTNSFVATGEIWSRHTTYKEHIQRYNNGLLTHPSNKKGLEFYGVYNSAVGYKVQQIYPEVTHFPLTGSISEDQITPGHPDYMIKTIDSLR